MLAYKVKAWWGLQLERQTVAEVAVRWHGALSDKAHREKAAREKGEANVMFS